MSIALYVDSSAILRAIVERGLTPSVEDRLASADLLVTSRLTLVETARAFLRFRRLAVKPVALIADAERSVRALWRECGIWELTREVCDLAEAVAPNYSLKSLDAIHLATFSLARREIAGLSFLTTDRRLEDAASGA